MREDQEEKHFIHLQYVILKLVVTIMAILNNYKYTVNTHLVITCNMYKGSLHVSMISISKVKIKVYKYTKKIKNKVLQNKN